MNTKTKAPGGNRRTKVVCTVGPGCQSVETLTAMIQAGMDVARLHFSYGSHEEHAQNIRHLRQAAKKAGRDVAILQDLGGTKVRLLEFGEGKITLNKGSEFTLTTRKIEGDASAASLNLPELIPVLEPDDDVLLNDGALRLRVLEVTPTDARCKVLRGGEVKSHQAVHVPGKAAPVSVPTEKDIEDVRFGLEQEIDWIAISFARTADEIKELKKFISREGANTPVVAKIERREALKNLDNLIDAADAIMVARGDLGMEVPLENVGLIQKDIIRRSNAAGKPVITATEMLFSMMEQPEPTRAEVTDITNAIFDGTDAVMLSGETSVGKHPVEATETIVRVATTSDMALAGKHQACATMPEDGCKMNIAAVVARGACHVASSLKAKLILCYTHSGQLAQQLSAQRTDVPVIAASHSEKTAGRCRLFRNVMPLKTAGAGDLEEMLASARKELLARRIADAGDVIVVVASLTLDDDETTSFIQVETL